MLGDKKISRRRKKIETKKDERREEIDR